MGALGIAAPADAALPIPRAGTHLTWRDQLGTLRMRLGIRRHSYAVEPGLYRIGEPTEAAPVLVTANYKLTFDTLRSSLEGRDLWLLVLDTKGINVWCAAGKRTFGTRELAERVLSSRLDEVVSHRTLVLPQLGASGVAAHEIEAFTGFRIVYGPVRAIDIPAFLDSGMQATPEMRRVTFNLQDRFVLTGVELSMGFRGNVLAVAAGFALASGLLAAAFGPQAPAVFGATALLAAFGGLVAGAFVTPLLLPWLPFRAFSAKGAMVGGAFGLGLYAATADEVGVLAALAAAVGVVTIASYMAMNFTGSSPITSPSGVEHEMRRALPWQAAGAVVAAALWVASVFV